MPVASEVSPDNSRITGLLAPLAHRWKLLAGLAVLAAGATFGTLKLMPPTYTSEAQIAVATRGTSPLADPKVAPGGASVAAGSGREAIDSHVRALQAPELARLVIADLGLASRGELAQPAAAGQSAEDRVLARFARSLMVMPAKDSRSILIRYSSRDRQLAAEVANHLAEIYRARLALASPGGSGDGHGDLVSRIDRLKLEVAEADAALERSRATASGLRDAAQAQPLDEQQLAELTAAESKARSEHAEAEARAVAARELETRGTAERHPDVQKSPVLQKLVRERARIEGDIAKAAASIKEGHPAMKQLRAELASTERQIALEVRRAIDGLDKEVAVAALRLAAVRQGLDAMTSRTTGNGADQAKLSQLEADGRAKRGELERLQAQLEANRARGDGRILPAEVHIVSRAQPAAAPSALKPLAYAAFAAMATLLLAASLSIARDLVAGARRPRPVVAAAEPLAATADAAASPAEAPAMHTDLATDPCETIVDLANRLLSRRTQKLGLRTLVAGAGVSVDPAPEAVELARTMARAGGSVLLIDWSLDGAGVARLLGLPLSPGLAELIDGQTGFVGTVGRVPGSTAQLIASGTGLVSASGRGDVDQLNLLLDTFDEIYEHIIVAARFNAARDLFETIEGRFDVGVLIGDTAQRPEDADGVATFLGFQVDDLTVLRLLRNIGPERRRAMPARPRAA